MSERPHPPPGSRSTRWRLLAPLALSAVFAALCATSAFQKSGTWDEYLLGIGLRRDHPDARFHPPLSGFLASLPFRGGLEIPDAVWDEPLGPRRGQRIVALRADDRMLDAARLALLPVSVGLGWLVFVWGRRLYGDAGGLLAMTLYSFDPNVIAHARLITPDLTLCATTAWLLYRLARLREQPGRRNQLWVGLALGGLLLAKYTALLLAPLAFATHALAHASGAPDRRRALARAVRELRLPTALGGLLLWAGYGFSLGPVEWAGRAPWLPAPDYVAGALYQWQQSRLPHAFFLLGERSAHGWWYFYLVVAALKVPLATGLLLALAGSARRWLDLPRRAEELYLWVPGLALLVYLSAFNTIHNGFRYLLPVWVPLLVMAGRLAAPASRHAGFRALLAVPLAWAVGASLWTWPDYIAYCNELIGGPRNGYHALSDSNLDWGQDLEALAHWMQREGVPRVQLAYFGTADPAHWGIDYVALPSPNSALPPSPPLPEGVPRPRFVALSAYQYQGVAFPGENPYARFHALEPNHRAGHSILIFDLQQPLPRRPPGE